MELKQLIYAAFSEELIESLAELEHRKWISWTDSLYKEGVELSDVVRQRWIADSVNYDGLSENQKERYKEWARKTLDLLGDWIYNLPSDISEIENLIEN